MIRRTLAALGLALLITHAPALAAVKNHRVKFRIPDAPYSRLEPGRPWQGEIRVTVPGGADIADFEFEGEGWQVEPLRTGESRAALRAGETVTLPLRVQRANPATRLMVHYTADGVAHQQPLNLRGLTRERVRTGSLRQATAVELAQAAEVPNAASLAHPPLPHDRRSRDAEGLLRGAVGETRLSDDSDASPEHREAQPHAATARDIRVRGRIMGQGPLGTFGADGVYFAVYDEDTGLDELLVDGTTDANGRFDVTFNWDPCTFCDSQPDLYVYYETENGQVFTQSPVLEWEYSWETGVVADYAGTDRDFGTFMPGDMTSDGALYVHTAITRMWRWYQGLGWSMPSVDVQCWDDDADPVSYYVSVIGEIHMSPARMFNTTSISHEYNHHWMDQYTSNPAPSYCNGNCDFDGDCGHCQWCEEPGNVVWTEGMPKLAERMAFNMFTSSFPGFTNDLGGRDVETIDSCGTSIDDGFKTEGLLAAAIYDVIDASNEDDPTVPGASRDELDLADAVPFQIFDQVGPTTVQGFFNELVARFPSQRKAIWSTAMNGGVNLDYANPGAPPNLISTSHTINVDSPDHTIRVQWDEPSDDWSGAVAYSVSFDPWPLTPDTTAETTNRFFTSPELDHVFDYYANVRAQDRFGRWSSTYSSVGPFRLREPEAEDYRLATPIGWVRPVVPKHQSETVTSSSVPAPALLVGNTVTTRWNAAPYNEGESLAGSGYVTAMVDGDSVGTTLVGVTAVSSYNVKNNLGPVLVRGGRHTFGAFMDWTEIVAETDETDNDWARQWSWSAQGLSPEVLFTRSATSYRLGGHDAIAAGESVYPNSDGFRVTSSGWWNAVWTYATDFSDDMDIRLHFPSSSPDTAFTRTIASSARGAGLLDMIVINRNTLGSLPWDLGLVNYDGGGSNFRVKHVTSDPMVVGDSLVVGFPADEFVTLHDLFVPSTSVGDLVVTLRTSPGARAQVRWFDRTFGYGSQSSATMSAVADSTGMARFTVNAGTQAYYGVMCHREPADGTGALDFTLQVDRAPADLAVYQPPGWYSPVVPRPATDGTFASVPLPDTLHGNTAPTYFNMGARNVGLLTAPPTSSWMMVDGVLAATYGYPSWAAGAQMLFNSTFPVIIRGGRHTLSHILDGVDLVEELVMSNNQYGEQFVWSPLSLTAGATVTRTAPPDRLAGWSEVTNGEALWFNSDGLRTANAMPFMGLNQWSAVAVMPGPTSDVDLRLHEMAPGTKNGFKAPLATSVWSTGMSDFVLANFNSTPYRRLDVGAVRWSGTESYAAQAVTSSRRTIGGDGVVGLYTQPANAMLDLHEVWLTPGTWYLHVHTVSGVANLGFSVHGPTAFQGKSNNLGSAWFAPAGVTESLALTVSTAGYHCIAVWKTGHADLAEPVTYRLVAGSGTLASDDTPDAVAFGMPWPNPTSGIMRVAYALPASGPVSIEVHDVQGARVRTLVDGEQPAGRHSVAWDGRDASGQRVAAGIYYLRFRGAGMTGNRRVVRLE